MGIFSGGSFPTSGGTVIITQDGYQTLNLTGNILTISGSNSSVDLSSYLDDTNTTNTSLTLNASNVLTLTDSDSGTVTVDLTSLVTAAGGTAESTHIPVKNTSGATITKGTPVYITGNVGSSNRLQIAPADASDPAKMPAIGLLETDLINNAEGYVVQGGYLTNITTDIIDGTSTSSNDTVYVKVGGGITMTKPTGSTNYIQNIAKVARVGSGSSGSLIVSSILRTNDIPNLADGQVWVGSTTYPVSTDFNLQEVTDGGNTTTNDITIGGGGTTATDAVLILDGGNASGGEAYISLQRNSVGGFLLNHSDSSIQVRGTTDLPMYFYTNNSIKQTILSNGNIGIGTTSPSEKLEVAGNILLTTNTGASRTLYTGGDTNLHIQTNTGDVKILSSNGGNNLMTLLNGGNIGINESSPDAKLHIVGSGNTSGTTALLVENSLSSDLVKVLDNGNVSIGGQTATQKLNLSGNFLIGNNNEIRWKDSGGTERTAIELDSSNDFNLGTSASGALRFIGGGSYTERMRVHTNGNIGIGTTSPSRLLDVNGIQGWSLSDNEVAYLNPTATGTDFALKNAAGTNVIRFDGRPNNNSWINNGGSFGIGTSSPSAFLEIANPTYSNATVLLGRQSGYPTIQGNGTSGGQWLMLDSNGGYLALNNHVTDNVILAWGGGDVAVGTGSPLARFHVKGSGNTSATTALLVENSSGTDTFKVLNDGQAQLGSYGSGTFTGTVSKILAVESGGNIIETTLSDLSGVDGSGTANYLPKWSDSDTLTDSLAYDDGGGQFVFEGSFFTGQSVATDSTNKSIRLATKHYTNAEEPFVGLLATSTSTANIVEIGGGTTLGNAATTVSFRTASNNTTVTGTERMRITSTGAVGIGTSSPSYKFTAYGSSSNSEIVASFGSANNQNDYTAIGLSGFIASNGATKAGLALERTATYGTGKLHFLNNSTLDNSDMTLSDSKMVILGGGNVGIGTSSPSAKLHIQNAAASNYALRFNYADTTDGGGFYESTSSGLSLFLKDDTGTTKTVIAPDGDSYFNGGNVGIGTSSPAEKLDVNGNIKLGAQINASVDAAYLIGKSHTATGYNDPLIALMSSTAAANSLTIGGGSSVYNTATSISFNTSANTNTPTGTAAMFINSSQNVGIGTTTPSAKTHIVGAGNTTSTTALLVESNNGTDRLRVTDGSEVFVNASTLHYGADVASTTLGYKEFLTDVDYGTLNTGAISVYTSESTRDTIMCDYKIYDGTNIRVGTVTATTDGTSVDYTDIRKAEVGDTSDMYFYAQLSGSNLQLIFYRGSAGYDAKYIIKNF